MLNLKSLVALAAASFALSLGIADRADAFSITQAYSFTHIADTHDNPLRSLGPPAINNEGTVVFLADLDVGDQTIFTGDGGALTPIANTDGGPFRSFGLPDINSEGTVVFSSALAGGSRGIFMSSGGTISTIADLNSVPSVPFGYFGFGDAVINDAGTVAFIGYRYGGNERLFTSSNGTLTNIADTNGRFWQLSLLALNNSGTVVFAAILDPGIDSDLFTSSGGKITPLTRRRNRDNKDTVAFLSGIPTVGDGLFTSRGGKVTLITDTSGPFEGFVSASLNSNNRGRLAFWAALDGGGQGIFTGPDPVADKVIAVGDSLFGSTVAGLSFFRGGFNDKGQVAFLATFTDGKVGIFRADPCRRRNLRHCRQSSYQLSSLRGSLKGQAGVLRAAPEVPEVVVPPKSVPEPGTSAALLGVAIAAVAALGRRSLA